MFQNSAYVGAERFRQDARPSRVALACVAVSSQQAKDGLSAGWQDSIACVAAGRVSAGWRALIMPYAVHIRTHTRTYHRCFESRGEGPSRARQRTAHGAGLRVSTCGPAWTTDRTDDRSHIIHGWMSATVLRNRCPITTSHPAQHGLRSSRGLTGQLTVPRPLY